MKEKLIHNEIPGRPWEAVSTDMFSLCNKNYICILGYHGKFLYQNDRRSISRQPGTIM